MARRPQKKQSRRKRLEPYFGDESPRPKAGPRKPAAKRRGAKGKSAIGWRLLRGVLRPLPKLTYWGAVFGLWAMIAAGGIIAFYAAQLPNAGTWAIPERPPNVRILAADGSLIANRGLTGGEALRLEDMSPHIPQAVIAIEDRRFHAHFGFDPIGFSRAMVRNVMHKRLKEGGSTITQQLAKNLFLTPERSFGRKVQELVLAVWLETTYTKAQILEMYLNRVYFGSGATGVDAASRRYFGKAARHVTLPEAALLAGLLKAPSRFSPARDPQLAQQRARVVLQAMQDEGFVKRGTIDTNAMRPGDNARHFRDGPNHYVADMVMARLKPLVGTITEDLVVTTTISPYLMTAADSLVNEALERSGQDRRVRQAALVALSPQGEIRALIGGRSYAHSQFNRATEARRQPGSAFKTFVWLAALERGLTPGSIVQDTPFRAGTWAPKNYDGRYRGAVTLGDALAQSVNTVAARLTLAAGPTSVAATARRLGIHSPLANNASIALGTSEVSLMELTAAYVPFANGGGRVTPWLIKRITTAGEPSKQLFKRPPRKAEPAVSPVNLAAMNHMLHAVVERGTGRAAKLDRHLAGGKTGTSQNFRDALFVGHTAHLVTGIWFGNDDNSPTRKLTGGSLPAETWRGFMEVAHRDLEPKALPGASGTVALPLAGPTPHFRPDRQLAAARGSDNSAQRIASHGDTSLRDRVQDEVRNRAGKSILDLILGRSE